MESCCSPEQRRSVKSKKRSTRVEPSFQSLYLFQGRSTRTRVVPFYRSLYLLLGRYKRMNHDTVRRNVFMESVHNRLLMEHVKILNIPNSMKEPFDQLLKDILSIVRYDTLDDQECLSWPTPVGGAKNTFANFCKEYFLQYFR
ncbi:hypothetical protein Q1695_007059 [Nippostrongylus brasiliensis]|nr:hypothetical protein Q1695_007059 [Nippostrongylus brasiliensis]